MFRSLTAGFIGIALTLAPLASAQDSQSKQDSDDDMRRAIQFERAKDRADARQERLERRHPTVSNSDADRRIDDPNGGNRVPDPGERQWKKGKNEH
jgi:Ni/Co efflux regulator RcnB